MGYCRPMRDSKPITKDQAVKAYQRLSPEDQDCLLKAASKLTQRTKLSFAEALTVFASVGMYLVVHD